MKFGLIGEKLGHSYSPWIHAQLMEEPYELKELSKEEVGPFLERREFQGINVTIPYKQTVIPYLDELDESAEAVGAVNTIVNRNGKLIGYNTDVEGFKEMLNIDGVTLEGKVVLILGNGGASKAVRAVVKKANPKRVVIAYRKPHPDCILTEDAYRQVADAQIIINATPVGMYPNVKEVPIDVSRFAHLEAVADVVYNPLRTQFILDGAACGAKVSTGLSMLIAQAICANEKFRDVQLDHSMILTLTRKLQVEKENIVLVGMPSSGKTT
ncbi:MAG: shikimate dehydrogenase, partial [Erysipelotrichaceae bacterium]|nr:shikimate dehydrogenase [Erysipelotrichaceae bacterium]